MASTDASSSLSWVPLVQFFIVDGFLACSIQNTPDGKKPKIDHAALEDTIRRSNDTRTLDVYTGIKSQADALQQPLHDAKALCKSLIPKEKRPTLSYVIAIADTIKFQNGHLIYTSERSKNESRVAVPKGLERVLQIYWELCHVGHRLVAELAGVAAEKEIELCIALQKLFEKADEEAEMLARMIHELASLKKKLAPSD